MALDPLRELSVAEDEPTPDVTSYGLIAVTGAGQVTIPVEARRDLGIEPNSQVMAFGELATGRLILTPPPLASELFEFVTERARARRSRSTPT